MIFDVEIHLENWPTGQATIKNIIIMSVLHDLRMKKNKSSVLSPKLKIECEKITKQVKKNRGTFSYQMTGFDEIDNGSLCFQVKRRVFVFCF